MIDYYDYDLNSTFLYLNFKYKTSNLKFQTSSLKSLDFTYNTIRLKIVYFFFKIPPFTRKTKTLKLPINTFLSHKLIQLKKIYNLPILKTSLTLKPTTRHFNKTHIFFINQSNTRTRHIGKNSFQTQRPKIRPCLHPTGTYHKIRYDTRPLAYCTSNASYWIRESCENSCKTTPFTLWKSARPRHIIS